jgi:hypothetical protein
MLRHLIIVSATLMAACTTSARKGDTADASQAAGPRQQSETERALTAQLDSNDVQAYVAYVCGLPQPERYEKAKALLQANHLVATCAFDKEHPLPEDRNRGPVAIIPSPEQK